MITRRWWWLVAGALAVVAVTVAIALVLVVPTRSGSDCETVRQLIDYTRAYNDAVTTRWNAAEPVETPPSDYEAWASQLKAYADEIHDPHITPHTDQVAALADQTVELAGQVREDTSRSPTSPPPPWVHQYAQLNAKFQKEFAALEVACPA